MSRSTANSPLANVIPFLVAAALVALAIALRIALAPWLDDLPFVTLFFVNIAVAWFFGARPALFGIALGAIGAHYFLLPPRVAAGSTNSIQYLSIAMFVLSHSTIVLLIASLRKERHSCENNVRELDEQRRLLQEELSGRKSAENALLEQRERLKAIFETAVDSIITINDKGIVESVNPTTVKLFGYSEAELVGKNFSLLMTSPFQESQGRTMLDFQSSGQLKAVGSGTEQSGKRKDGSIFPIEVSINETHLTRGQRIFTAVVRDITRRKRAENELREGAERFHQLADAMPQIVFAARPDGHLEYFNERWYDYTDFPRELSGDASWHPVLYPEDRELATGSWIETVTKGTPFQNEFRFTDRKNGGFRWFLCRALPARDTFGNITRWYGTCTDIHDLKTAQEALLDADRRKDEFLATLAHELRNPLAPVRNALQIVQSRGEDRRNAVRDAWKMIERQVAHLARLVDDLMDVSRITRGKINLKKEIVDIKLVVDRAVECSNPLIVSGAHPFEVSFPAEKIHVDADVTRLSQVFMNLLNNAAKYTPSGGRIWLKVTKEHGQALVSIRDEGMGIPASMLPKVFDLFTQVDSTIERAEGGLGIGLTLVRSLATLHGGSVEAFSEGVGKGSEFVVRLPITDQPISEPSPKRPDHANNITSPVEALRVLIVDDNYDAAESLAMLFKLKGCETSMCHDGPTALENARKFNPRVILLDIGMPGMSGYEVAKKMREMPETRDAYLIAQTGWGQDEDRQRSREAGFDLHLVKPLDFTELLEVLVKIKAGFAAQAR